MRSVAKTYWILVALLAAWLLVWIVLTWPTTLDDALIHLRFADHLWHQHIISYDGVHRSFGTSSLLYVALLAVLRGLVTTSPVLPRVVSSVALLALFSVLAAGLARRLRGAPALAWMFSLLLLTVFVMPSSIRWLDDGMETAITLIFTTLLALSAWDFVSPERRSLSRLTVALLALGFFTVMLRVEMLLLLAVVSATILSVQWERRSSGPDSWLSPRVVLECVSPVAGGLLGAALIVLLMHTLLPDTAVAKSFGFAAWNGMAMVGIFAASMSFGLGPLLLWLLSFAAAVTVRRGIRLSSLVANSTFPIVMLLTVLRGQAVQGVRYFEWALLFSILWNILDLSSAQQAMPVRVQRAFLATAGALGAVLLLSIPVETHLLMPLFRSRENALAEFRQQNLERISNLRVVAFDVGYFGYFTGSPLCDMAGLINGREAAALPYAQRVQRCAEWQPQAGFLDRDQMRDLNAQYDLSGWSICGEYEYVNLRLVDPHFLIAAPAYVQQVCAAAHGTPRPLAPLLPLASP
jgi:hypothetical protein